ncbi:hypothetical protein [Acinetobacter nosocomialis]|uniref:hypothetical protein n=1 Tax=Acinetobacter nosocomialis TaxID=106654 RepID=UPI0024DEC4E8|nr:hypothetical protein [Acinetobacter nosocomialis]
MDKLSQQELIRIRRGAEDAIQAMNRNHRSFIEAVSHPLNIIALVDMAQASVKQQAKVEELQKQINNALEQVKKLYIKAERDYENECNPYYDGMLSALDLAEQAIKGELEEQALNGNCDQESDTQEITGSYPMPNPKYYEAILKALKGGEG